jgi:hypothetical protein
LQESRHDVTMSHQITLQEQRNQNDEAFE